MGSVDVVAAAKLAATKRSQIRFGRFSSPVTAANPGRTSRLAGDQLLETHSHPRPPLHVHASPNGTNPPPLVVVAVAVVGTGVAVVVMVPVARGAAPKEASLLAATCSSRSPFSGSEDSSSPSQ